MHHCLSRVKILKVKYQHEMSISWHYLCKYNIDAICLSCKYLHMLYRYRLSFSLPLSLHYLSTYVAPALSYQCWYQYTSNILLSSDIDIATQRFVISWGTISRPQLVDGSLFSIEQYYTGLKFCNVRYHCLCVGV